MGIKLEKVLLSSNLLFHSPSTFLFFSFLSLTFFIIQIELSNVIHRILTICDGFIAFQVSIEHATKVL